MPPTSGACKLLEKVIRKQIDIFLVKRLDINERQYGFRGKETLINFLDF